MNNLHKIQAELEPEELAAIYWARVYGTLYTFRIRNNKLEYSGGAKWLPVKSNWNKQVTLEFWDKDGNPSIDISSIPRI